MFSAETKIKILDYRIQLLSARDPVINGKIIKALMRERRKLEKQLTE